MPDQGNPRPGPSPNLAVASDRTIDGSRVCSRRRSERSLRSRRNTGDSDSGSLAPVEVNRAAVDLEVKRQLPDHRPGQRLRAERESCRRARWPPRTTGVGVPWRASGIERAKHEVDQAVRLPSASSGMSRTQISISGTSSQYVIRHFARLRLGERPAGLAGARASPPMPSHRARDHSVSHRAAFVCCLVPTVLLSSVFLLLASVFRLLLTADY